MIEKLKLFLFFIPKRLLRLVSYLYPRNKKIWLFSSWNGNAFADNAKYFFLYTIKNQKEIDAVWFTKNLDTKNEVESYGGRCVLWPSFEAFSYLLRTGVFISTHLSYDFIPELMGGAKHIELFHASFPLKKMGYDVDSFYSTNILKRMKNLLFQPFLYEKANFCISSSDVTQKIFSSCLQMPTKNFWQVGFPRIDSLLLTNDYILQMEAKIETLFNLKNYRHFFYFVPTFRNDSNFSFFNYLFSEKLLTDFLDEVDGIFIIRLHPFDLKKEARLKNFTHKRIIFENHKLSDPYPLLRKADVLITDFSSIFADYLLLNRPMIFAKFGYEDYMKKERNLYWNYEDVTPGTKVSNWPELITSLRTITQNSNLDEYEQPRQKLKELIFSDNLSNVNEEIFKKITSNIFKT